MFVRFGSLVLAVTVAVFEASVAELNVEAVTLIVIRTRPPTLTEPRLQVTVPEACEQLPCVVEADE